VNVAAGVREPGERGKHRTEVTEVTEGFLAESSSVNKALPAPCKIERLERGEPASGDRACKRGQVFAQLTASRKVERLERGEASQLRGKPI
jgi:hypothetical protein